MSYKKDYYKLKEQYDELKAKNVYLKEENANLKKDLDTLGDYDTKKYNSELCRVCVHRRVYKFTSSWGIVTIGCDKDMKCGDFVPRSDVVEAKD